MSGAFIAVAVIMLVLLCLVVLIIRSLSVGASIKVRSDMAGLLKSYDNLIDARNAEISKLQDEIDNLKRKKLNLVAENSPVQIVTSEEKSAPSSTTVLASANYRTSTLGGDYDMIRSAFGLTEDQKNMICNAVLQQAEQQRLRGELAKNLKAQFSMDTIFNLSLMSSEEQLSLLDDNLNDRDWVLLRDYVEENGQAGFDIAAFCTWLDEIAQFESTDIELRSSESSIGEGKLCEGIQIVLGNTLYDYGINESEIV